MRGAVLPWFVLFSACAGEPNDIEIPELDAGARDGNPNFLDASLPPVEAEAACAMQSTSAVPGVDKQVDIIFVIDNSGSMAEEIDAVRENINDNFARIIAQSGVDYRVIMLSLFGATGTAVCIDPPLAGAECETGVWGAQSEVYFHYDVEITSSDAWCKILSTFDSPDPARLAPGGFQDRLRAQAEKVFVLVTDDSASCVYDDGEISVAFGRHGTDPASIEPLGASSPDPFEEALRFHQALLARSPEQFGVPPDVRYRFYSIVGLGQAATEGEPWFPHQGVNEDRCDSAASAGTSYQALSIVTDSLRYPVCEGRGFDAIFRVLARNVVESAKAECSFEIPQPPPNRSIDRLTINVEYHPGDGGEARRLGRADSADDCDAASFVLTEDRIELCPEACRQVEADRSAEVTVHYACTMRPD